MSDETENVQILPKCVPAADAKWWSHHWIGPKGGDCEPWVWTDEGYWVRGGMMRTVAEMTNMGWVYAGPCEYPEVVADLRRRLAAAEARLPPVVVSIAKATGA